MKPQERRHQTATQVKGLSPEIVNIDEADSVCQFATITHEGPFKSGKINGKPVDLAPPLVNDSPFIRSPWDSGVAYIRKGDEAMILDFSDPKNPKKTVGVKPDERFPAGVGQDKPIIFGKAK